MADQAQLAGLLAESDPISNLNAQLPVASPVSIEDYVEQCSALIHGVDPRSHTNPQERSILIPKSRVAVTPFQLWEAWKMLNQRERTGGLRGGLQASAAGTGKSFIVLAAALLRARCFESSRQVKAYWAERPRRGQTSGSHLPASASGDGLKCPSQRDGDILCYCVPNSKSRGFIDSGAPSGVCLIQAPLAIMGQWISVFERAVLDTSAYNLVVLHHEVPPRLKRDFTRTTKSLSQPAARGSLVAPETYIFLSSHGNTKMLDTFTKAKPSVGIMFSDESHYAMRVESRSMAIAEAQSSVGQGLDLWLVSATPIRILEDWELPVRLFSISSELSRAAAVADIIAARTTARSSDENMATFQAHWSRVFDENLVLRNTVTSLFCGKPITDLQVVIPERVFLTTPQRHFDGVQEVAYQAREVIRTEARMAEANKQPFQPEYASVDTKLHFVSLFPGAANLILQGDLDVEEETVRRGVDAIKEYNSLKVEKVAGFQQNLDEITSGSPKLDFIMAEIERMRQDNEKRPEDPMTRASLHRDSLTMKKMVIITPTLSTAIFLYLFLLKRVPALNPALFHTRARPRDCEAVINSFTSLTTRKNARHSYILITPFSSGGTGLNLQSANYQILTSPLSTRDSETQCFARTNRTGQKLALHHSVLISQDNPADQINVVNFGGRKIRNDPFEMRRRLVLAEPDGSKAVQRLEDWGYEARVSEDEGYQNMIREVYPNMDESEWRTITISAPSVFSDTIDIIIYFDYNSVASGTLAISEAWNDTSDTRPRHEKLPLRDILLTVWVRHHTSRVRDLRALLYFIVVESNLRDEVRPLVYRLLGEEINTKLVVHRESESPQEAEAFSIMLERAPFCAGAQKMLEENPDFEGVQIESFEFLPPANGENWFDFRINFR